VAWLFAATSVGAVCFPATSIDRRLAGAWQPAARNPQPPPAGGPSARLVYAGAHRAGDAEMKQIPQAKMPDVLVPRREGVSRWAAVRNCARCPSSARAGMGGRSVLGRLLRRYCPFVFGFWRGRMRDPALAPNHNARQMKPSSHLQVRPSRTVPTFHDGITAVVGPNAAVSNSPMPSGRVLASRRAPSAARDGRAIFRA
jgi:hypothetical protein